MGGPDHSRSRTNRRKAMSCEHIGVRHKRTCQSPVAQWRCLGTAHRSRSGGLSAIARCGLPVVGVVEDEGEGSHHHALASRPAPRLFPRHGPQRPSGEEPSEASEAARLPAGERAQDRKRRPGATGNRDTKGGCFSWTTPPPTPPGPRLGISEGSPSDSVPPPGPLLAVLGVRGSPG